MLKNDPGNETVLRSLKSIFARRVADEAPSVVNGHAPAQFTASAHAPILPPLQTALEAGTPEAIIKRFEPLLVHGPKNIKVLETLAQAYARKTMFDKALSLYQRALEIMGGKNPVIEEAIAETTLKKLDLELSQVDPKAPDQADQRERIQNRRLDFQWHEMEETHTAKGGS
jgi:predicted Zn-dependent protease